VGFYSGLCTGSRDVAVDEPRKSTTNWLALVLQVTLASVHSRPTLSPPQSFLAAVVAVEDVQRWHGILRVHLAFSFFFLPCFSQSRQCPTRKLGDTSRTQPPNHVAHAPRTRFRGRDPNRRDAITSGSTISSPRMGVSGLRPHTISYLLRRTLFRARSKLAYS
jgi:hypothetical protein